MKKPNAPAIRELLRKHPDGLTNEQIRIGIGQEGMRQATMLRTLQGMPDAYVDRWRRDIGARGQFTAIWCVVVPPTNCPYPTDRPSRPEFTPRTIWIGGPRA